MTYSPNIPQADDLISESQGQILTNFTQLNTVFGQDHTEYDDATVADRGKHKQSTYPDSAADPVNANNEVSMYSKDVGGNSRLFMRQEGAAGDVIQMSGITPTNAANGFTFLPGGLLMQWNRFNIGANASLVVLFPTAFGAPAYSVVCQMVRTSTTNTNVIYADSVTATQFTASNTSTQVRDSFYIAIGTA